VRLDDILLYGVSAAFGVGGAWAVARWGSQLSLLDMANHRSSHVGVVPKGGGIGILTAFSICAIVLSFPKTLWIPATLLSLFSLWGDRSEIRPRSRLSVQFAASILLLVGFLWTNQCSIAAYLLIFPFALFIVGTANYYNFMDGINGIAGITGIVGFALLALFASISKGNSSFVTLAICMAVSCLGFLPFNIPKARVFMGDVGSILLGFVFAGMVVWNSRNLLDFICLASFLFPFYADELTTLVVRLRDGEKLFNPHRRHLYQLLANELKIAHWKVSTGYGIFQLIVGLSVLVLKPFGIWVVLCLLTAYLCGFVWLNYFVRLRVTRA
jgi:Fuc2NAc and GlcNAc transferase